MRQFPVGKGVGGKTRMNKGERRFHRRIFKIGIKRGQLRGHQHPLVDERPAGKGGDVDLRVIFKPRLADDVFEAFADDKQPPFEGLRVHPPPSPLPSREGARGRGQQSFWFPHADKKLPVKIWSVESNIV